MSLLSPPALTYGAGAWIGVRVGHQHDSVLLFVATVLSYVPLQGHYKATTAFSQSDLRERTVRSAATPGGNNRNSKTSSDEGRQADRRHGSCDALAQPRRERIARS